VKSENTPVSGVTRSEPKSHVIQSSSMIDLDVRFLLDRDTDFMN
jgi:hypothetical protein